MEILEAIYQRRAVRRFTPADVSDALLLQLLQAAVQAPSSLNLQPWSFAIFSGRKRLAAYSKRIKEHLLLTRYSPSRVASGEMMSVSDVKEILGLDVVGVVPESPDVLSASNAGVPVILNDDSNAARAYEDAVARLLGEDVPLRFIEEPRKGFFARMFGL